MQNKSKSSNQPSHLPTALPSDVARAAGAEERLGSGADALCGRQPGRGGRHPAPPYGRLYTTAQDRSAHAPRARAAGPSASQDEGTCYNLHRFSSTG